MGFPWLCRNCKKLIPAEEVLDIYGMLEKGQRDNIYYLFRYCPTCFERVVQSELIESAYRTAKQNYDILMEIRNKNEI